MGSVRNSDVYQKKGIVPYAGPANTSSRDSSRTTSAYDDGNDNANSEGVFAGVVAPRDAEMTTGPGGSAPRGYLHATGAVSNKGGSNNNGAPGNYGRAIGAPGKGANPTAFDGMGSNTGVDQNTLQHDYLQMRERTAQGYPVRSEPNWQSTQGPGRGWNSYTQAPAPSPPYGNWLGLVDGSAYCGIGNQTRAEDLRPAAGGAGGPAGAGNGSVSRSGKHHHHYYHYYHSDNPQQPQYYPYETAPDNKKQKKRSRRGAAALAAALITCWACTCCCHPGC